MSSPTDLALLTETLTEADAILIRDALADHDIRAVYNGDLVAGFRAEAPGMIRVLVQESDLARAKQLLSEHGLEAGPSVDWSQVDVGEPEDA